MRSVFALVLTLSATAHASRGDDITVARNIFCSGCTHAPPGPDGTPPDTGPRATTLPIELVSTLIAPGDARWAMAVMRDLSTRQKDPALYNAGAQLAGAVVVRVLPRRVYLRNAGRLEYVDLEAPPAPATPDKRAPPADAPGNGLALSEAALDREVRCQAGRCTLARALVTRLVGNTALLATSVRVMPLGNGGFRLDGIRPGSLFARLQLHDGDTLRAVNGSELTTPDAAILLYTRLRSASHISLQIERDGRRQTLDYAIE
jgi:general secretion pathway protein C